MPRHQHRQKHDHGATCQNHWQAGNAIGNISQILHKIGGSRECIRRILFTIAQSIILYYALMQRSGKERWQRYSTNCRAYRNISTKALLVIAKTPPINLTVEEICSVQQDTDRKVGSERTLTKWQEEWNSNEDKGAKKLIPNIKPCINRKHGKITYYLTHLISGHSCFQSYKHSFFR